MSNVLISVRDLSVAYEGTTALDEVSLDIFENDFLGVIGPNGGGKTSLVRAILGNIPYRGTVNYAAELFRGKERLIGICPNRTFSTGLSPYRLRRRSCRACRDTSDSGRATPPKTADGRWNCSNAPASPKSPAEPSAKYREGRCSGRFCALYVYLLRLLILDEPANFVDNQFEMNYTAFSRS